MAPKPHTDGLAPEITTRRRTAPWMRHLVFAALGMLLFAVMPASAAPSGGGSGLVEQLGSDLGASGGGVLAFVIWFLLMLLLIVKGLGRCYSAVDHMGSLHEEKRRQGREEIKYGGITFAAGLIGVPVAATFVGRILPESWSWMGVDLTQYVQLPGAGGGGDSGTAGMAYVPVDEIATAGVDTAMMVLPALV